LKAYNLENQHLRSFDVIISKIAIYRWKIFHVWEKILGSVANFLIPFDYNFMLAKDYGINLMMGLGF